MKNLTKHFLMKNIILIIIGLFAIITPDKYITILHFITYISILLLGIYQILKSLRKKEFNFTNIICSIIAILLFSLLKNNKDIYTSIISIAGSLYLFIIGLTQLFTLFIYKKLPESKLIILFSATIHIIFSFILFINPNNTLKSYTLIIGIYLVLIGIRYIQRKNDNCLSLIYIPTLFLALKPYFDFIKIDKTKKTFTKKNIPIDMEILIHVRKTRRGIFGHTDICYDNKIYSYGNYDKNTFKLGDAIGEGFLIIADKEQYISYCKSYGKSLFSFGIKLTNEEKDVIKKRIDNIMINTIPFDKKNIYPNTYIDNLNKNVNTNYYKFKNGYYQNYFFLNYNCVKFIEELIAPEVVNFTSIKTPGTMYSYLDYLYLNNDKYIVSKKIY